MTGLELLALVALFVPVAALLERTHRRTAQLPRTPLGADAESHQAAEYRRQVSELRQLEQLAGSR